MFPLTRYIVLGDSISIDVYPTADAAARHAGETSTDRLGAASLLVKNDDKFWPEFQARDLRSRGGAGLDVVDLAADGATTESLLRQVARIGRSNDPVLVTITAGGNDLLGEIGWSGGDPVQAIGNRFESAVRHVLERVPEARVILATVYDPSDGSNKLPGYGRTLAREAAWLAGFNDFVRRLVTRDSRLLLADIHAHFLGHGLTAPENERWYLAESIIEPNARGASEVRRLWLQALGE